jgi:hypothetical protein
VLDGVPLTHNQVMSVGSLLGDTDLLLLLPLRPRRCGPVRNVVIKIVIIWKMPSVGIVITVAMTIVLAVTVLVSFLIGKIQLQHENGDSSLCSLGGFRTTSQGLAFFPRWCSVFARNSNFQVTSNAHCVPHPRLAASRTDAVLKFYVSLHELRCARQGSKMVVEIIKKICHTVWMRHVRPNAASICNLLKDVSTLHCELCLQLLLENFKRTIQMDDSKISKIIEVDLDRLITLLVDCRCSATLMLFT